MVEVVIRIVLCKNSYHNINVDTTYTRQLAVRQCGVPFDIPVSEDNAGIDRIPSVPTFKLYSLHMQYMSVIRPQRDSMTTS